MKKVCLLMSSLLISAVVFCGQASALNPVSRVRSSDDRLLSPGARRHPLRVNETLVPDAVQKVGSASGVKIDIVRLIKGKPVPVSGLALLIPFRGRLATVQTDVQGRLQIPECTGEKMSLLADFQDSRFKIQSARRAYSLVFQVPCQSQVVVVFKEDSLSGEVVGIFQVLERAANTLAQVSDLKFWNRQIIFTFPADGDYYTNDAVFLTSGRQWDVVAHEMGHAIYDQAAIGSFGGGPHKIDECYSDTLALSEGWASFFAAWTQLDLHSLDPKFEYMVPRRAPLSVETIPDDVCRKPSNEWRVMGFFWDLLDSNIDGEISQGAAKKLWNDLLNARVSSARAAAEVLVRQGWSASELNSAWSVNF